MSRNVKSMLIGAGVGILLAAVAGLGYMMAKSDSNDATDDDAATTGGPSISLDERAGDGGSIEESSTTTSAQAIPTTAGDAEVDFAALFGQLRSGVGRVDVVTCETVRQSTGFLVRDNVVLTSAEVVTGAAEVAVTFDDESIEGVVIGLSADRHVAAIQLAEVPESSQPFEFSKQAPEIGDQVGALVLPSGQPLALEVGAVSDIDQGVSSPDRIWLASSAGVGASGGPLVDEAGQVVGVVRLKADSGASSGTISAIPIADARALLTEWVQVTDPVDPSFCVGNVDLDEIDAVAAELIVADTEHSEIAAIQRTFAVYSQSINSSRAENAFGVLGPAITRDNTAEAWAEGQRTSNLWDWRIRSVEDISTGLRVRSVFTSTQDAEFGFDGASTCTRWDITHDLVEGTFGGQPYWLINRSRATEGSGPVDCAEWTPEIVQQQALTAPRPEGELSRTGRLAGGTVDRWDLGIGDMTDDKTIVEGTELTVSVTAEDGFDPVIEIYDENGVLVAQNDVSVDGSLDSEATANFAYFQVLNVYVRDQANRSGGEYTITFSTRPL